jgi:hypothetical protein
MSPIKGRRVVLAFDFLLSQGKRSHGDGLVANIASEWSWAPSNRTRVQLAKLVIGMLDECDRPLHANALSECKNPPSAGRKSQRILGRWQKMVDSSRLEIKI